MKFILILLLLGVAIKPAFTADKLDVRTDLSVGYSFLSSDDNPWLQNHCDFSEGLMLENLKLIVQNGNTGSWFDSLSLEARAGDRLDTGRVVRFQLKKAGRYSFTLKQSWNRDYFADTAYNYGANDRNLTRNNVSAEFRWTGFKNLALIAGYSLVETTGTGNQPFTEWNDIYALRLNRDTSRESYTAGLDYRKGAFRFMLRQSFVTVNEQSRYGDGPVSGTGLSTFATELTPNRSGKVESTIPVSSARLEYAGNSWWASVRYSHSDATIDNDV
ncbi:MAG: hypothetical protein KAH24_00205, partial [Holophagae bacterium]|nr:hypothetical protein [Holophagae bacterium]